MNLSTVLKHALKKCNVCCAFQVLELKHAENTRYSPLVRSFCGSSSCNQKTSHNNKKAVYLIDENNIKYDRLMKAKKYTDRTCTCGELRSEHAGQKVTLCGWLEYRRMNKFVILRDGYGEIQLVIADNDTETQELLKYLPYESIIRVEGTVLPRPLDMINRNQPTGEIEVSIENAKVLNTASEKLPFNIREFQKAKESLRMKYRYLDLRFTKMQQNLRVRSRMFMDIREFLINEANFVDVETPTLFKATPGGAQEFVVPTRSPGQFYSLVQSPQQFKQMLMAGGIDRYFQIARCYRDEGSRPDRQPEFTQLDIEMSFTTVEGVIRVVEELLQYSWPDFLDPLPNVFRRITYEDAMLKYGTDKPDTRFGFELKNCTDVMDVSKNRLPDFHASCLLFEEPLNVLTKSVKEKLADLSKQHPEIKFVQHKAINKEKWINKTRKLLGAEVAAKIYDEYVRQENNVIFLAFGPRKDVLAFLGKVRLEYVNYLEENEQQIRKEGMHMLWVVEFPLFEAGETPGSLTSVHHPFTSPHPDDLHLLDTDPLQVRSLSYDLVLNGHEVGGGSIRIHNPTLQEKVFNLLSIDKNSMQHILDMLGSGCPPHGGIALGLDRLLAVVLNTQSIRDVIAFPKTFEGKDPISGAPSPITDNDKKIYHIQTVT